VLVEPPVALTPDGLVDASVEVFENTPVLLNAVGFVADVSEELLVAKLLELFPVPIIPLPAAVLLLLMAVLFQKTCADAS